MSSSRFYKQGSAELSKAGPRVYTYQNKELSSIQQQIVEDISQSSFSQTQTQYDEDSFFTFCQSQNKQNPKLTAAAQSVEISVASSKGSNSQFNKHSNNQQQSVQKYLSSSNNLPKPNNKRGKSQNSESNNQYQRCNSLNSLSDSIGESFLLNNSINSSVSFSNSFNPTSKYSSNTNNSNRNRPLNLSLDSINTVNKRLTRSATLLLQNQLLSNNLLSGISRKDESMMSEQNSFKNTNSSRGTKNPISIIIKGKNQNNNNPGHIGFNKNANGHISSNDCQMKQIETTKYKKKETSNNISEDHQMLNGATTTTQPKQRKNEMNMPLQYDHGSIDYYQSTAKQISQRENQLVSGSRLLFQDDRENKSNINNPNIHNNPCLKMVDENQKPIYKIVKREDHNTKNNNLFQNNSSSQTAFLNPSSYSNKGARNTDSAQTSVTQCKDSINRDIKYTKFTDDNSTNGGKKILNIKKPFFLFEDEDEEDSQNKQYSLKSSDETHLNIDDHNNNIWNRDSGRNFKTDNQNGKTFDLHNGQINQQNLWDKNGNSITNTTNNTHTNTDNTNQDIDVNKIFQKKLKNSLQNKQQFIGVDSAFTINYEKMRFTSDNSKRIKHFEFNCFRDKDLQVDQKYQKKIQELTIDDDNQTDEETLDYYIEVCFNDLIVGIDMNKQQETEPEESESSSASSSKSSKEIDPRWQYYRPPNFSGEV